MIEQNLFLNILILSWFIQTKTTIKVALSQSPPQGEKQGQIKVASLKIKALRAKIKMVLRTKILL